ncbi:MAG: prepilin-type N-terminal cleavage/methylation domain-containing protein [Candidatus Omnitrophica bacterium]|nr:prepilin-type N-terminal cleavage/methylation domain-containing protein [Candidatus Omnitrophota bacterium]MDD5654672.1 prepilin-type N-terminal cleavage/methylation domain-containing protein [Candidatus Omnitrophota bacterium]
MINSIIAIKKDRLGFTLLETVMVIVILGIMGALAIPKFVDLRIKAEEARAQANIGAMRAAILIYYSKTAMPQFQYLCNSAANSYRSVTVANPCFPASNEEIESLLTNSPNWGEGGSGGACYDASSGQISSCQ